MSRIDLDIHQPEFLPVEVHALHELVNKHEQYLCQGRDLEARGMARAVGIVFRCFKGDFHDTQPTSWAEIEG
jgi:hypothetical protein